MKELDLLLSAYLERHYDRAPADHQRTFRQLLERSDPELHALLVGNAGAGNPGAAPESLEGALLENIRSAVRSAVRDA